MSMSKKQKVYLPFKRVMDIIFSFLGILILSPVFIILILIMLIPTRGRVFFLQNRIGKNKKIFKIIKFRSMKLDTPKDIPTDLLKNPNQYVTKIGKFLRRTSLDELPQLFNIFIGQMSFVGPRPALYNQDKLIQERDSFGIHDVTPGLTGLAQVNGRENLSIEEKVMYDAKYVKYMGFAMDFVTFFKTFGVIFK